MYRPGSSSHLSQSLVVIIIGEINFSGQLRQVPSFFERDQGPQRFMDQILLGSGVAHRKGFPQQFFVYNHPAQSGKSCPSGDGFVYRSIDTVSGCGYN